jgi:murein L,D-transpeptidase YcbB/YkuD
MKMRHLVVATSAALVSLGAIAGGQQHSQSGDRTEAQAIQDATTVRQAQERLRSEGYAATPDGLKEFQQAKGLSPSGKLDQQTLAALGVGASASSGASSDTAPQSSETPKN